MIDPDVVEPLSVAQVAARLRWSPREVRARLQAEHVKRDRKVLYRSSKAKNAKMYVYPDMLALMWPRTFGSSSANVRLREALEGLAGAIDRVLEELRDPGTDEPY